MKIQPLLVLCFFTTFAFKAQESFHFLPNQNKVEIPFQLINNLIFIPIEVNGVPLNFLLDSGVEETILFSLDDKKELNLFNVAKIQLRGLGSNESIEGLKSTNNSMRINGLIANKQDFYIILDQSFNLSSHIGIPVNGIIGTQFLKNNLVEIDYLKKKIKVSKSTQKYTKQLHKKFVRLPISIEKEKPYLNAQIKMDSVFMDAKMLIDIGNSDAIWIFQNSAQNFKVPNKNFDDFLGKGFSGTIEGKRAKISNLKIGTFQFVSPIVSFPDSTSLKQVKMVSNRVGSIGSEIFRRFKIVFDYTNGGLYLRKNGNFNSPFRYNKSGIEIEQNGLKWVEDYVKLENNVLNNLTDEASQLEFGKVINSYKYKFELKPNYNIVSIRKKSAAEKCGLKAGDEIISINGIPVFKFTLEKINTFFTPNDDKIIVIVVLRDNNELKFTFHLESEL